MSPRGDAAITTVGQAAAWLEGLINVEKRPDWPYRRFSLAPIRALLERLGSPEHRLEVLHVAGSKGKGSTALLAEALLREAGLRTGTFTSPHLVSWTERFRIDGAPVGETALAAAVDRVRPEVEALHAGDVNEAPTFFDATTATAFLLFAEAAVERAVVEVGLGGRLDSTNACEPAVTCVTSIELEHTDRLGDTLAAIAGEKAGILKPGVPAVVGALPDEALDVVLRRAAEVEAPVAVLGREIRIEVEAQGALASRVRVVDGDLDVRFELPLPGSAAPANAALALACVRRCTELSADPLREVAERAFANARLPGRIEVVEREPAVIVDAAHTPASARALARVLDAIGRPVHLVLSVSGDKDLGELLDAWLPRASRLTATRAEPLRSLDPAEIARAAQERSPKLPVHVDPDAERAVRTARADLPAGETLCVAGSVYLAGIAREVLAVARPS